MPVLTAGKVGGWPRISRSGVLVSNISVKFRTEARPDNLAFLSAIRYSGAPAGYCAELRSSPAMPAAIWLRVPATSWTRSSGKRLAGAL
jgi:hypothetical protein